MAIYLDEDQFGNDTALVGFPHILLCMGVVVMTSNDLYGAHLGWPGTPSDNVITQLRTLINNNNVADDMKALYGCCNRVARFHGANDKKAAWKAEMTGYANTLQYTGNVYGFCTSIITPKDGTYVEYHPEYQQDKCKVFYKRNEKMTYTSGNAPANVHKYSQHLGQVVPFGHLPATTGASVVVTKSNKGQLHEVNYFLRMTSFEV